MPACLGIIYYKEGKLFDIQKQVHRALLTTGHSVVKLRLPDPKPLKTACPPCVWRATLRDGELTSFPWPPWKLLLFLLAFSAPCRHVSVPELIMAARMVGFLEGAKGERRRVRKLNTDFHRGT